LLQNWDIVEWIYRERDGHVCLRGTHDDEQSSFDGQVIRLQWVGVDGVDLLCDLVHEFGHSLDEPAQLPAQCARSITQLLSDIEWRIPREERAWDLGFAAILTAFPNVNDSLSAA